MLGGVLYSEEKKEYFIIYSHLKGRDPREVKKERTLYVIEARFTRRVRPRPS